MHHQVKKRIEHWHIVTTLMAVYDAVVVNLAYMMALVIRFDLKLSMVPAYYYMPVLKFAPLYAISCVVIFHFLKLYRSVWSFASYMELLRVMIATFVTMILHTVGITLLFRRMPLSYYIMGPCFQFMAVLFARFAHRFLHLLRTYQERNKPTEDGDNIMLIGAGEAGHALLRDIQTTDKSHDRVLCIIDDNSNKWGRDVEGIPIEGGRDRILECAEKYAIDKIIVAIPSASAEDKTAVLNICKETGCELKNLPGMYQLVSGDVSIKQLRDVAIEDLLGRDPIDMEIPEVRQFIQGKKILVTGGGGSIGSELCRQIAAKHPQQLIILDVYENNAYEIQQELKRHYPELNLVTLIGSVRDSRRLEYVFDTYRPQIVYHAAAHKHVPLMEDSPCEAIKNNTVGTYKTGYFAMKYGVERFILISTDKAVNPTNVMGASKRLCEMIVQMFDTMVKSGRTNELPNLHAHRYEDADSSVTGVIPQLPEPFDTHTEFVAVRFGNVLGSNGSVIPLFREQIAEGGPVTVTDKRMIRYFMTIPEAVGLVLQAGVMGKGSEIFVLDMGSPVRIDDLARNLIKLSGLKPDEDIKIVYTGLRPGEKLYEEKLMAEEGILKTPNQLIFIGQPIPFDEYQLIPGLRRLLDESYAEDPVDMKKLLQEIVVTYKPMEGSIK